jgi:SAM-dependent methyltransferase
MAIDLGDLRRLEPIDGHFGGGRGKPIDRHYIERFLRRHATDVRGRVLEVGGDDYTRRFGGARVVRSDVLHVAPSHAGVTLVADLAAPGEALPDGAFDCFICTQTLQYVFDLAAAMRTIHRLLAPGGVLLLSVPGISQLSPYDRDRWGEHWRFTPQSVARLLGEPFGADGVAVQGHGNVLAAIGFLHGLACEDLTAAELDAPDDRYPLVVTARAAKAQQGAHATAGSKSSPT